MKHQLEDSILVLESFKFLEIHRWNILFENSEGSLNIFLKSEEF